MKCWQLQLRTEELGLHLSVYQLFILGHHSELWFQSLQRGLKEVTPLQFLTQNPALGAITSSHCWSLSSSSAALHLLGVLPLFLPMLLFYKPWPGCLQVSRDHVTLSSTVLCTPASPMSLWWVHFTGFSSCFGPLKVDVSQSSFVKASPFYPCFIPAHSFRFTHVLPVTPQSKNIFLYWCPSSDLYTCVPNYINANSSTHDDIEHALHLDPPFHTAPKMGADLTSSWLMAIHFTIPSAKFS